MKKIIYAFILGSIFILSGCSLTEKKNIKTAKEFYDVYAERQDVDKLMGYYSSLNPQLIDAVPQIMVEGKENIKNQYVWNDSLYKKHPDFPKTVTIKEILANDSVVVVNGQYNPYYYNGYSIKEMKFNAWLYFDKEGKIKRLIEWTQYPMDMLEEIITIKKSMQIN